MCLGLPLQGLQILEISHRPYKINMHKMLREINTAIIKKDKHQKCSEINRNVWKNAIEMKTMIIRIKNLINGQLLDFPCRGQINHATSNIEKTRQSIWNKVFRHCTVAVQCSLRARYCMRRAPWVSQLSAWRERAPRQNLTIFLGWRDRKWVLGIPKGR